MSARALDGNSQAGRSRDVRYNPERNVLAFEQRALFNVQFHKGLIVTAGQLYFLELSFESRLLADFFERRPIFIRQFSRGLSGKTSGEQAAAQTPDSKPCRFLSCKNEQFDGP